MPARLWVGELSLLGGEAQAALEMARPVTKRRPLQIRGWKLRAAASLALGDLEDAGRSVAEGVSLDPSDAELAILGARISAAAGDVDGAIATLRAYLQVNPQSAARIEPVLEELFRARG